MSKIFLRIGVFFLLIACAGAKNNFNKKRNKIKVLNIEFKGLIPIKNKRLWTGSP